MLILTTNLIKTVQLMSYTWTLRKHAFDTVSHNELLYKLWRIGITGPLWFWFKDYLSGRLHYVSLPNANSSMLQIPVISGVSQGSILGPLLFLIYVNDVRCFMFADDTKLLKAISKEEDMSFNYK